MSANQTRRRTSLGSATKVEKPLTPATFQYQPLDLKVDCTRFVRIHPAEKEDDPLSCDLVPIPFGDRPEFQALSYRWGDESTPESILIDGARFDVGKNLWDGLRYLRTHGDETLYWIDALCINQEDVMERNRQLRMMGHIYFRATTVVVWLGAKYLRYQNNISVSHEWKSPWTPKREENSLSASDKGETHNLPEENSEQNMAKDLCADDYWNRVWIVQEVVQQRHVKVCFGKLAMDWDHFIHYVTTDMTDREGPSKLDRHRKERYGGSHTFLKLLRDYRTAQCKEPRDKIYGLVGLAADAKGFPIDYQKPLIDIWVDTIEFVNQSRRRLVSESDMIEFGRLVKNMLMGTHSTPLQQVACPYQNKSGDVQMIEEDERNSGQNEKVFQQNAFLFGYISHIGPSAAEIVGSLQKVDDWAEQLQEAFASELGNAHKESNGLLEAILKLDHERLETACPSHVSTVRWTANISLMGNSGILRSYKRPMLETGAYHYRRREDVLVEMDYRIYTRKEESSQADRSIHLYQLYNPVIRETPWKMGVTSGQAQLGDLICWIYGIQRAILVRVHEGNEHIREMPTIGNKYRMNMQIIGTALVTEDVKYMAGISDDQVNRREVLKDQGFPIKMDARTLFLLLG